MEYVASIGWKFAEARIWVDPKLNTEFVELNLTCQPIKDLTLVTHAGYLASDINANEYWVGHLKLKWQGYSLLVSQTDIRGDNPHVVVSHTWNFDLKP